MNMEFNMRQEIVDDIRQLAEECGVDKVILFGSRARGDHKERSDIDLAVTGGDSTRFAVDADEVIRTLIMFDVVNLDGVVQEALRESIGKEGKIIYEKFENFQRTLQNLRSVRQYEEPYEKSHLKRV